MVFSTATFHWILDHRRLFERLHAALVPGGRMEAQCGGIGNVEDFLNSIESVNGDERFAPYLRGVTNTWNFASPGDTEIRLTDAGFDSVRCWLEDAPVQPRRPARVHRDRVSRARTWTGCPQSSGLHTWTRCSRSFRGP